MIRITLCLSSGRALFYKNGEYESEVTFQVNGDDWKVVQIGMIRFWTNLYHFDESWRVALYPYMGFGKIDFTAQDSPELKFVKLRSAA